MTEMELPMSWGNLYPWLCLVRINRAYDGHDCGVLFDPTGKYQSEPTVYVVDVGCIKKDYKSTEDFVTRCPKIEYASWDELKKEWRLD